MLLLILMIVLLLALFGSLPTWPHSRNWGYYPSGGISLVVLILLILFLNGAAVAEARSSMRVNCDYLRTLRIQ